MKDLANSDCTFGFYIKHCVYIQLETSGSPKFQIILLIGAVQVPELPPPPHHTQFSSGQVVHAEALLLLLCFPLAAALMLPVGDSTYTTVLFIACSYSVFFVPPARRFQLHNGTV